MRNYLEWIDTDGYWVRDTWSDEKQMMVGKGKLELREHQRDILGTAFKFNDKGVLDYETILYSCVKKSGKTAVAGSVGAWYAECGPAGTEIYVIANDLEQAEGRVMRDIKFHYEQKILKHDKFDMGDGTFVKLTEKNCKITLYKIDLPNGTFIQALAQSYRSAAGSRHALTLWDELWGVSCTDTETECYTKGGWKKYNELTDGELIATFKVSSGKFEWQPLNRVITMPHKGQMCQFTHRRANMLLTPNHRVLGKFRTSGHERLDDKPLEFKTAAEAVTSYEFRLPRSQGHTNKDRPEYIYVPGCTYTTRTRTKEINSFSYLARPFLALLGYYLSEGNVIYYKYKDINVPIGFFIGQRLDKHPDIYEKIRKCLDELDIDYQESKYGFRVQDKRLAAYFNGYGKSYDKYIPEKYKELDSEYLWILFNAFMDGDGWRAGHGWQTELSSLRLIDDLMEIGLKLGFTVRYMGKRWRVVKNKENTHWMYRASFSLGNITLDRRNMEVIKDWEGTVWCPSVENKTWLARRNGNVFWTGNTELTRRTWDELTPIPTVSNSVRFVATYAGFENESDLLWGLYMRGVGEEEREGGAGTRVGDLAPLPCWTNGKQFTYWDTEPRMPWQTDEYYDEQLASERPAAFLRLHKNQWVTSQEEFIPLEWWKFAEKKYEADIKLWDEHPFKYWPMTIGVDAGQKRDSTALVMVGYDAKRAKVGLCYHKIWTPQPDDPVDLDATVEKELLELYNKYKVASIVYDPTHLIQTMIRLKRKGLPVREFTQSLSNMTSASQLLYDLFKNRNLEAYPATDLERHIRMAVAENSSRGFRLVKNKVSKRHHIDGAIALAMACYDAVSNGGVDTTQPLRIASPFKDKTAWKKTDDTQNYLPPQLRN